MPEFDKERFQQLMNALQPIPRKDHLDRVLRKAIAEGKFLDPRVDDSLAPLMQEKLRYTYTKIFEQVYPEYAAAMGEILPIDSRVPAGAEEWEYFKIDQSGYADWIADDGTVMPSGSLKAQRFKGQMAEMGHKYDVTLLELERASFAGVQLSTLKQADARKAHEAFTNWVWLFGDSGKGLHGLITHPNIPVTVAPAGTGPLATYGDNRNRLIEAKTVDEILADVEDFIERVPKTTIRAHFVTDVWMSYKDVSHMKWRRMGTGDGDLTLWQYIQNNYASPSGENPAVRFHVLNECDADFRVDPRTAGETQAAGTDTSGVTGRFWLATPPRNVETAAFIRARPFTQRPPQEIDLKLSHLTHSKIGGCKLQIPLAFHRKDFLANDVGVAAP